jgi:hypothetical protein
MKRLVLTLPFLLVACGTPPEPFLGRPGLEGARLAQPPAPVLFIPTPLHADLSTVSAQAYTRALADALAAQDVPSVPGPVQGRNWHLDVSAAKAAGQVTPDFAITGPDGKVYGRVEGTPQPQSAWEAATADVLSASARQDSVALSQKLSAINATIQQSNPESLENRTPRIYVGLVSGAPGDGDQSLPYNLAKDLGTPELEVTQNAQLADFTVTATVKSKPDVGGQVLVELDWQVKDSNGRVAGQVTQLHDLNPRDISPYWGDVAAAAATEAASGVQDVVRNAVLKKHGP